MRPIIIEPLITDKPEIIEIRTTNLESFWLCPMKYRKSKVDWNKDYFEFGKVVHNAIQAYVFNPGIKSDILEFVCEYKPDYCSKVWSYLNLVDDNILAHWYRAILNEVSWMIEIHYWKYKILIEWTADLIFKRDWVDWYIIWDIKTSKAEWKEWVLEKKLQRFVYTYMLWQKVWFDSVLWFEYMIFTKHVHPRFQSLWTYKLTQQEMEDKIKSLIVSYIYSLEHDDRPAIKNQYCWWCPLKKNKKCPIYWWTDFNL